MDTVRQFLKKPQKKGQDSSWVVLANPTDAAVDIVFVHGFGGHLTETWTANSVCWPSAFLKSKVERARIIAFGYNAEISRLLPHIQGSVSDYAVDLLSGLAKLRTDTGQCNRALIFVVHSIGSTIVKEALCHSSSASQLTLGELAVARACRGVVFLGAAHRECRRESLGQIASRAAAVVQPSFGSEILCSLEKGSLTFDLVNDLFLEYIEEKREPIKTITFFEESGEATVGHESAVMDSPHHRAQGLPTNHRNMCRFFLHDDPSYVAISGAIRELYEDVIKPQQVDCEVLVDCPDAQLDVIFVHSMGCDNVQLWTHDGAYWPKALLPADLPYSRVIAYHYHTDFPAFLKPDQTVMQDLAIKFLLSLLKIRTALQPSDSQPRPILFIAHSTGGTLTKQVLNISHLASGQVMHSISIATKGIIFFGTPHQNDKKSNIGQIMARAIRAGSPDLGDNIIEAIERDSAFEDINRTFQDYLEKRGDKVHIVSFYEQKRKFRILQQIVTEASASLPSQRHLSCLQGSHANLCQLRTREEYQYIVKQIRNITDPPVTPKPSLTKPKTPPPTIPEAPAENNALDLDYMIQRLLNVGYSGKVTKTVCLASREIAAICLAAREVFLSQPTLLQLAPPVKVAGDIHGQYSDLIRLFEMSGFPPSANYLFLGNYVDEGKQSLETILLLLCYKIKYPENFFLLRGNHECANVTRVYGFYDECKRRCNLKTWKTFIDVFNCLPIAAIVASKIFCVHGGLSPSMRSMDDIKRIRRPTDVPDYGLLNDLLWSDPSDTALDWEDNERGVSYCFGKAVINAFLVRFDMDLICRSHMVVEDGYEFWNDRTFVTVCSAPNYTGVYDNFGACMSVNEDLLCEFELLKPLDVVALGRELRKIRREKDPLPKATTPHSDEGTNNEKALDDKTESEGNEDGQQTIDGAKSPV